MAQPFASNVELANGKALRTLRDAGECVRPGANIRRGRPRNIAASVGANGCRPIGGQRENHHPDCPWEVALLTLQRRQSARAAGGFT
jgi:hypothetical protein